jgi:hypothetical protein
MISPVALEGHNSEAQEVENVVLKGFRLYERLSVNNPPGHAILG